MSEKLLVLDELNNRIERCASAITVLRVAIENEDSVIKPNVMDEMLIIIEKELRDSVKETSEILLELLNCK